MQQCTSARNLCEGFSCRHLSHRTPASRPLAVIQHQEPTWFGTAGLVLAPGTRSSEPQWNHLIAEMRHIYNQGDLLKKYTCTGRSLQRQRWGQHIGHDKACTGATDAHSATKLHSKDVLMWSFCLSKTGTNSLCPLWLFVFTAVYNVWHYVKANYVLRLSPGPQMQDRQMFFFFFLNWNRHVFCALDEIKSGCTGVNMV